MNHDMQCIVVPITHCFVGRAKCKNRVVESPSLHAHLAFKNAVLPFNAVGRLPHVNIKGKFVSVNACLGSTEQKAAVEACWRRRKNWL